MYICIVHGLQYFTQHYKIHEIYSVHVFCSHSVKVEPDGMESLITLSEGDMRRALNILQVVL